MEIIVVLRREGGGVVDVEDDVQVLIETDEGEGSAGRLFAADEGDRLSESAASQIRRCLADVFYQDRQIILIPAI